MKKKKIILLITGCLLFVYTTIIYNPFEIIRLELFFNDVEKVEIYSYKDRSLWIESSSQSDLEKLNFIRNYKVEINEKYLKHKLFLDKTQINDLKNGLRKSSFINVPYKCYNPRHSIIFYDDKNDIFGYIEICFECNRVICSENLNFISLSALNLESTFKEFGITYFGEEENN